MPKYNIASLNPKETGQVVSATLKFTDTAMNVDLMNGTTIFQTINNYLRLEIRQETSLRLDQFKLLFALRFTGTSGYSGILFGRKNDRKATVQWTINYRSGRSAQLHSLGSATCNIDSNLTDSANSNICTWESPWMFGSSRIAPGGPISYVELSVVINDVNNVIQAWRETHVTHWTNTSFTFARLLVEPTAGDVVFIVRDADGSSKKLYAYKSVLAGNSEYFVNRLKPEWRPLESTSSSATQVDLETSSSTQAEAPSASTNESHDHRQVIYLDDPDDDIDFVTLHNILYYIYIGCVNLPNPWDDGSEVKPLPEGFPGEPDPYRLYRNADKFLLPSLKTRCYVNLTLNVTPENVAERLFHKDCQHYEELKNVYLEYLLDHYDKVKNTEGWEKVICNEEDVSPAVWRYRTRLLLEISRQLRGRT